MQDWVGRLEAADARVPAGRLYYGRGFAESESAAEAIGAPLFIVSAGLGMVAAETQVPSYSLTVTPAALMVFYSESSLHRHRLGGHK